MEHNVVGQQLKPDGFKNETAEHDTNKKVKKVSCYIELLDTQVFSGSVRS